MTNVRGLALAVLLMVSVCACDTQPAAAPPPAPTTSASSEAAPAPSATSPTAESSTAPAEPQNLETVLVSLDDVRAVAGFDGLTPDTTQPTDQPRPDPGAPPGCGAVFDQGVAFGADVTEFRTTTYTGMTDTDDGRASGLAVVTQGVGRYADAAAARSAFDRLQPELEACAAQRVPYYEFTVDTEQPSTVTLDSEQWRVMYRVTDAAMVTVVVLGLDNRQQVAEELLRTLTERL